MSEAESGAGQRVLDATRCERSEAWRRHNQKLNIAWGIQLA